MSNLTEITASVLEKVANYIDAIDEDRKAALKGERLKTATSIKEKLAALAGDSLDEKTLDKLADADGDVLAALTKIAESVSQNADSLGGPAGQNDRNSTPDNKEEAARLANDRFLAWTMS